jgi:hypothetical protein
MAILSKGKTWGPTEQIVTTDVHNLVDAATFASGAVDGSTTELSSGAIAVKDLGITNAKLAGSAVKPTNISSDSSLEWSFGNLTATTTTLSGKSIAHTTGDVTMDFDEGNFFVLNMDGDVGNVNAMANMVNGRHFTLIIKPVNATRSITSWDSTWKWFGGSTPAITGTADSVDIVSGVSDGTNMYVTMLKNFA